MLRYFAPVSVIFLSLSSTVVRSRETVYKAVGDEVVLTADPMSDPITVITWKHGQDIAVEWSSNSVYYFRQFKERSHLNTTTGALTVTGLTLDESGNYTAEINDKEAGTTQLSVINRVSKPNVSCQCDNTNCNFTCESDTTNAEPAKYSWIRKEKSWMSGKEITITKDESEEEFHCKLENPISSEISDTVQNPFHVKPGKMSHVGTICSVVLFICFLVVFILYKRNKITDPQESSNYAPVQNGPSLKCENVYSGDDKLVTSGPNSTVAQVINEETERILEESPDQVQTNTVSTDTVNKTEEPETSNQGQESDVDQKSSSEDGIGASTQQVVPDATNEAGESAVAQNVQDSCSQNSAEQDSADDPPIEI